jgi:hypothetical protein
LADLATSQNAKSAGESRSQVPQQSERLPPIPRSFCHTSVTPGGHRAPGPDLGRVLAENRDPDEVVIRRRVDGSVTHPPVGIRLAQAVHHGTDHRSQIATALTALGIEPPGIDLWDYAVQVDRVVEIPPSA